jgi:hypothetical protein
MKTALIVGGVVVVGVGGYLLYRKFSAYIAPTPKPVATPQDTKANLTRDLGGLGFDLGKYVGDEIGGSWGKLAGSVSGSLFQSGFSELGKEIFG